MSKIQVPPNGLFSLLGIVGSGERPDELDLNVRPSIEMWPFYSSGRIEIGFASAAAQVPPFGSANITVPDGQRWAIYSFSGSVLGKTLAATCRASLIMLLGGSPVAHYAGTVESTIADVDAVNLTSNLPQSVPFVAGPGDRFFTQIDALSAGTATLSVNVAFVRLRA